MVGTSGLEPPTSRLSGVRSNHLSYAPISVRLACSSSSSLGGDEEDRTPDTLRARQVLSQLSYTPMFQGLRLPLLPTFEGLDLQNRTTFNSLNYPSSLTESFEEVLLLRNSIERR